MTLKGKAELWPGSFWFLEGGADFNKSLLPLDALGGFGVTDLFFLLLWAVCV